MMNTLSRPTDDTYPGYCLDYTTSSEISSSSTPVHVPYGSTMEHAKMGSTGTPHRQAAQVSTRRKPGSPKNDQTWRHHGIVPAIKSDYSEMIWDSYRCFNVYSCMILLFL
jgi:hypothetical protein